MKLFIFGSGSSAQRYAYLAFQICASIDVYFVRRSLDQSIAATPFQQYLLPRTSQVLISEFSRIIDDSSLFIISNPTSEHLNSLTLIRRYSLCPVLIDKPFFSFISYLPHPEFSLANTWVGYQYRYSPLIRLFKQCFPRAGLLHISHMDDVRTWHPWEEYLSSYSCSSSLGGGCLNTLCHSLDLCFHILGDSPQKALTSISCSNSSDITVDDMVISVFEYNFAHTNTLCSSTSTFFAPTPSFVLKYNNFRDSIVIDLLSNEVIEDSSGLLQPLSAQRDTLLSSSDIRLQMFKDLLFDFFNCRDKILCPTLVECIQNHQLVQSSIR